MMQREADHLTERASASTTIIPPLARSRGAGANRGAAIAAMLIALAIVVLHVILVRTDYHTATPLWGAEWLFNLMFNLLILSLSTALGRKTLGRFGRVQGSALADYLATLAMGFGVLSLAILALGLAHLLYWPIFLLAGIALAVWLRRELQQSCRDLWHAAADLRRSLDTTGGTTPVSMGMRLTVTIMLCTLVSVCVRNSIQLLGDAPDFDGVTYHISAPKLYLAAHHVFAVPDIPLANAPSAVEMFSIPGLMAGTDMQMKVLNLLFALLLGAAVYGFTRRHLRADAALLSVVLLFLPTWIVELMAGTVPDFATALFAVLALDDIATWLDRVCGRSREVWQSQGNLMRGQLDDGLLIRGGILAGIAVSCKLTTAPLIPAMALAAGVTCLIAAKLPPTQRLQLAVRACTVPSIAAIALLAPWFIKNIVFFRNPIYPLGHVVNGAECTGGITSCVAAPTPGTNNVPPFLQSIWHIIVTTGDLYWHYCGPLSVAILLAVVVLRTPSARFSMLFLLFGAVLWLKFVPLFNPPRYWLSMLAIGFALSAATLSWTVARLRMQTATAELPLLAYLIVAAIFTLLIGIGLVQRSGAAALLSGTTSRHDFLAQRVRPYQAIDYVNQHTFAGTEVATVNMSLGYYLDAHYLNDWFGARFARLQAGGVQRTSELTEWCKAGVTLVVFNRGLHEYNPDDLADIRPASAFPWLRTSGLNARVLYSRRGVDVLSVQPCHAVARLR